MKDFTSNCSYLVNKTSKLLEYCNRFCQSIIPIFYEQEYSLIGTTWQNHPLETGMHPYLKRNWKIFVKETDIPRFCLAERRMKV